MRGWGGMALLHAGNLRGAPAPSGDDDLSDDMFVFCFVRAGVGELEGA